jgi:peptide/nickel transport system substrate-binding protein
VRLARSLLDQAGLRAGADGVRFHTSLIFDSGFARQAELIKSELGDVGIDVDLKLMEMNTWVRKLYTDWDFDMGYTNFTHPPDPDIGWKRIYVCSNIVHAPFTNGSGYCNSTVDKLFDQAQVAPTQKKRAQLYRRIQRILARDLPVIPLVDGIGPWIWRNQYRGFDQVGAKGPFAFGERAWWTKGSKKRTG